MNIILPTANAALLKIILIADRDTNISIKRIKQSVITSVQSKKAGLNNQDIP